MTDFSATPDLEYLSDKLDLILARGSERWPSFMSIETAANYCDLSVKSIRRLVDRGELSPCKPIGRLLIPRKELDETILAARSSRRVRR